MSGLVTKFMNSRKDRVDEAALIRQELREDNQTLRDQVRYLEGKFDNLFAQFSAMQEKYYTLLRQLPPDTNDEEE